MVKFLEKIEREHNNTYAFTLSNIELDALFNSGANYYYVEESGFEHRILPEYNKGWYIQLRNKTKVNVTPDTIFYYHDKNWLTPCFEYNGCNISLTVENKGERDIWMEILNNND